MKKTIIKTEKSEVLQKDFDLIRGEYTAEDAQEILNNLITHKIHFHERKSFSSQIRYGHTDEKSLSRVKQLQHNRELINEIINEANSLNKNIRITSKITVEII